MTFLDSDNDRNALYYGNGAGSRPIVVDHRFTNLGAEPIRRFMVKWHHFGGVAPSSDFLHISTTLNGRNNAFVTDTAHIEQHAARRLP